MTSGNKIIPEHDQDVGYMIHADAMDVLQLLVGCAHEQEPAADEQESGEMSESASR